MARWPRQSEGIDTMASTPPETASRPSLFQWMAHHKAEVAYALLATGGILMVLPLWLALKYRGDYLPTAIMTTALAVIPLAVGLWQLLRPGDPEPQIATSRLLALAVGGLFGFGVVLVAAALAYQWWDTLVGGVKEWQGPNAWRLWLCVGILLVGLALVFVSLQLGRTEERSNHLLRRLLYGYNAVLTGILLCTILIVVNVLVSVYLTRTYDWTAQSIYALSSLSENVLRALDKPAKVYVIMPQGGDEFMIVRRVQGLLDNCRAVNPKLQVEYLSPDLDRDHVNDLAQRYHFAERIGLLVVYGIDPNTEHQFIGLRALIEGSEPSQGRSRDTRAFKGESELVKALSVLEQGKQKPVLYFLQGDGELDLNDSSAQEPGQGAALLKERLEGDNYTVKGLQLTDVAGLKSKQADRVLANQVPEDADVVVVAGPQRLPKATLDSLRQYMQPLAKDSSKKRGKLVVMADAPQQDQVAGLADLQAFLAGFNVQLGHTRVLSARSRDPRLIMVTVNPSEDVRHRNTIAGAFDPRQPFYIYDAQTVTAKPGQGLEPARYRTEDLLVARAEGIIWAEKDLRTLPAEFLRANRLDELRDKLSQTDLPVAVTVSESTGATFHGGGAASDDRPCMVVFGDAAFVSNWFLRQQSALGRPIDLFTSALGWLSERPAGIGVEPRRPDTFEMNVEAISPGRLFLLPAMLMIVGALGLGTGVWLVRRR